MCKWCLEAIKEDPSITKVDKEIFYPLVRQDGYVYFFATEDLSRIKIGFTFYNPYDRMKMFQKYDIQKLIMIANYPVLYRKTERAIHQHFKSLRIGKREWFVWDWPICGLLKDLWYQFACGMTRDDVIYLWGMK
jgi:hypothetical protein